MRRLYLQVYLTIVASLVLVVLAAGLVWHFISGVPPFNQAFEVAGEVLAELVPPARSYVPEFSPLEMGEVSPEDVAQALEALYRDPVRRQELARAAVSVAQNPAHSWDVITRQFDELVVRLADGTEMEAL